MKEKVSIGIVREQRGDSLLRNLQTRCRLPVRLCCPGADAGQRGRMTGQPSGYATQNAGRRGTLIVSLASALLYHLAKPRLLHLEENGGDIVQVMLFFSVGIIAAKLTDNVNNLPSLIAPKSQD